MFEELQPDSGTRRKPAWLISSALHVLAIAWLLHRAAPVFVMPSEVALGNPNSSGSVVYLSFAGAEKARIAPDEPKLPMPLKPLTQAAIPKPVPSEAKNEDASSSGKLDQAARAGSPYGGRVPGAPLTGHEVVPAIPQVFPDPVIARSDLPPGVEGNVIVEVTIDEQGSVIGLKVVRGLGYGIEDRVLAALRQWHFRPASKDGVAIASQHLAVFHYPS